METLRKKEPTWYGRAFVLAEMRDAMQNLDAFFDGGKHPKWLARVLVELMSQTMPAIPVKELRVVTPEKVGRFWGQKFANLYAFGGKAGAPRLPQEIEKGIVHWKKQRGQPNASLALGVLTKIKPLTADMGSVVRLLERNVLRVFRMALGQPNHQEAVAFFGGFAVGLAQPGVTPKGPVRQTTATAIYSVMFIHWREVDCLSSVPKLREFLLNHGLSESVVGDISRLRRLCTRIGYAPGKRGRPRKLEK